jgi:RNA polymerase sigma-70 factor, ECF subfamily
MTIESFYSNYYDIMVRYSYSITRCHYWAEDAVGEMFRRFIKMEFDDEEGAKRWMYVVTKNFSLKILKKNKRYVSFDEDEDTRIPDETNFLEDSINKEKIESLLKFVLKEINKLPEKEAKAMKLRYLTGKVLDYETISRKTNSTKNAVGFLLHNATRKLKRLVAKWQNKQTQI